MNSDVQTPSSLRPWGRSRIRNEKKWGRRKSAPNGARRFRGSAGLRVTEPGYKSAEVTVTLSTHRKTKLHAGMFKLISNVRGYVPTLPAKAAGCGENFEKRPWHAGMSNRMNGLARYVVSQAFAATASEAGMCQITKEFMIYLGDCGQAAAT